MTEDELAEAVDMGRRLIRRFNFAACELSLLLCKQLFATTTRIEVTSLKQNIQSVSEYVRDELVRSVFDLQQVAKRDSVCNVRVDFLAKLGQV